MPPFAASVSSISVRCPFCGNFAQTAFGGETWTLKGEDLPFQYASCSCCELLFANPQPTDRQIERIYGEAYDYSWFARRWLLKKMQAKHRYLRISSLIPLQPSASTGKLLDIGCGHGWFLEAARSDGWRVEGLDLLSEDAKRTSDIEIHYGSIANHRLKSSSYNLITLWHALEHMRDPIQALASVENLLVPGGLCVIAVPNLHAAGFRRFGRNWVWCQQPFVHPWHFSERALKACLPIGLHPVYVTSRDTWDAQWFETTVAFRAIRKGVRLFGLLCAKLARASRLKFLERSFESITFWSEELIRLGSYASYLLARPFISNRYERALRGSELMIVAKKMAKD